MANLGQRLRQLRNERKMTQEELSEKFFINKSSISRYENNTQMPELELLLRISNFFDVSLDYLIGKTENRNSNVYTTTVNNHTYTIEIDKGIKKEITQEDLNEMIKKLKSVGFDINKLLEKNDSD